MSQSQKTAGKLWRDGGLSWKEFLPEDQDVNKFVTEQVRGSVGDPPAPLFVAWRPPCAAPVTGFLLSPLLPQKLEYTMGGDSSDTPSCKELTSEELCKQMDKLLKENPNNQRIYDWIEVRAAGGTPTGGNRGHPAGSAPSYSPHLIPPAGQPERGAGLIQHVYQGPDDVRVPFSHRL